MGTLELAVVGLAGSGIGTALGLPMVWPALRRPSAVRLMGGWLLALSVIVAIISARVIGLLPATAAVSHAINLVGLAAYPLVYLYVRLQVGRPLQVAGARWLWAPAAVYVGYVVVRVALGLDSRVTFAWMLPVLLAFTTLCIIAASRNGQRPAGIVPVEAVVGFLVMVNLAQVIRMLFGHVPLVPAVVPLVVTTGFVGLVSLVVGRTIAHAPKYERSGLDQGAAMALLARVDRALSEGSLVADTNLTLARLAAAVDSTPHQVSEVLNRYAGVTFSDRLNRARVAQVKAQLLDPASDRYTIEGIGLSAGFGSRSALYAAFRRIEGMTPTECRAQRRALQQADHKSAADEQQ